MLLSDNEIIKLVQSPRPLIAPFNEKHLQSASYDVTLGDGIQEIVAMSGVVNLLDQRTVESVYDSVDISNGYILKPGQFVLCKIAERIELPDNIAAHIMPRTRFTRFGLLVSAQHCNPSYAGYLSIGLHNASSNNVSLVPGMAVAQIVFEQLSSEPSSERLYRNQKAARYHNEDAFIGSQFIDELSPQAKAIFEDMVSNLSGGVE
ncbi:dCTP deaminase [Collinsella sp. CLA-ER-H7]|uniref:dCTP deaminase n=1 Tax=Collinsella sp. CLA-ER-H7 TaxID=3136230 RepID=UPI0032C1B1EA